MTDTIDKEGYRANVGIVLVNSAGKLLWARRKGKRGWQFPQGGINSDESSEQAMYRELKEEVGLEPEDVKVLGRTDDWLKYNLPRRYQRLNNIIPVIGQKQHWFLLKLEAPDEKVKLDCTSDPEFDRWRWVSYWYPVTNVIFFKQSVYQLALKQLYRFVPNRENISPEAPELDENSRHGDYRLREGKKPNSNKKKSGRKPRRHGFPRRVGERVRKTVNKAAQKVVEKTADKPVPKE